MIPLPVFARHSVNLPGKYIPSAAGSFCLMQLMVCWLALYSVEAGAANKEKRIAEDEIIAGDKKLLEEKTGVGWRHSDYKECTGGNAYFRFKVRYYWVKGDYVNYETYGVLRVTDEQGEQIYLIEELFSYKEISGDECALMLSATMLLLQGAYLDAQYVIAVNVREQTMISFGSNIRNKTPLYKKKVSDDIYLVAGFGLTHGVEAFGECLDDEYCMKSLMGSLYLQEATGWLLTPGFPLGQSAGVAKMGLSLPTIASVVRGWGAFQYHVLCDRCGGTNNALVRQALKEYIDMVFRKFIAWRLEVKLDSYSKRREFHEALLAVYGILISEPELRQAFGVDAHLQTLIENPSLASAFREYWRIALWQD